MNNLKRNVISGVSKQMIAIVYGFILPRLILVTYGSKTYGLISSIGQFLTLISCLDFGMTAVVQASLYKPLSNKDYMSISCIMTSANRYFKTIACVLLAYVAILSVFFPIRLLNQFTYWYVVSLIIALSIDSFSEFYFGIVHSTLIKADQKSYIYDYLSVLVYLLTIILCYFLIKIHASIQTVKIVTALVFLIRPICISVYVKKRYSICFHAKYDQEPIKQKWNGVAQHLSAIVIDGTDIVVLTLFSSLQNVSIYSVYNLVVTGVKSFILSVSSAISAIFGKLIAEGDERKLFSAFAHIDWIIHTVTIVLFGCTTVLIGSFVSLYTHEVNDANYSAPVFSFLITIAGMMRCIRLPYNSVIIAAGHFRQTQSNYIIAVIINISLSVLLVIRYGLVGVTIGTIVSFAYQVLWMVWYVSNNIVKWPKRLFLRQITTDIIVFSISFFLSQYAIISSESYLAWIVQAIIVFVIWTIVSLMINWLLYKIILTSVLKKVIKFG